MGDFFYSVDTETALIQPGLVAPPPVVLTWADGRDAGLVPSSDGWRHQIEWLRAKLPNNGFVGFNFAFDAAVILAWMPELTELLFTAYDEGRIHDIGTAERLGEIATGRPDKHTSLARLASLYNVAELDKANSPRLDYARFMFQSELPTEHRKYAIDDAVVGHETYRRVRKRYGSSISDDAIASESRHAFWLAICAAWGLRVNPERLEDLKQAALERQTVLLEIAREVGFVKPDGRKNTKRLQQYVCQVYGIDWEWTCKSETRNTCWLDWKVTGEIPEAVLTDAKRVGTNKTVLLDSGDTVLEAFAEWGEVSAALNKDVPLLENGVYAPIHTSYGLAGTTRTTSRRGDVAGGNLQNFGRKGGARECLEPRAGCCYGEADVGGLESGTLAQVLIWCTGGHALADKLNAGVDVHLEAACFGMGLQYDKALRKDPHVELIRQFKKIPNYGFPGGMGAETLTFFGRQQLEKNDFVQLFGANHAEAVAKAEDERRLWQEMNPEIAYGYLRNYIRSLKGPEGRYTFYIPGSPGYRPGHVGGILRRSVPYCSAANGHFQGLGAQVMKAIGWDLTKDAWLNRDSALYVDRGARMASFVHDSFFYEIPIGAQHPVMSRVQSIMLAGLKRGLPDIIMGVDPVAMSRWSKKAKTLYNEKGELQIWEPN